MHPQLAPFVKHFLVVCYFTVSSYVTADSGSMYTPHHVSIVFVITSMHSVYFFFVKTATANRRPSAVLVVCLYGCWSTI